MPLQYGPGVPGAAIFRIRESYVRDTFAKLLSGRGAGTAKLDLALRGVAASLGEHGGGAIPAEIAWEQLHDLVRPDIYGDERVLKRKWVGDRLEQLEHHRLIERTKRRGGRSALVVLSDRGDGSPFDYADGSAGNTYVTMLGGLISFSHLASWGGPEIAAYIAAMTAERYARAHDEFARALYLDPEIHPVGGGVWSRPYSWFADADGYRPEDHVRFPFSERTLRRGFAALSRSNLIVSWRFANDPLGTGRYDYPRRYYWNGFDDLRPTRRNRRYVQLPALRLGHLTWSGAPAGPSPSARTDDLSNALGPKAS